MSENSNQGLEDHDRYDFLHSMQHLATDALLRYSRQDSDEQLRGVIPEEGTRTPSDGLPTATDSVFDEARKPSISPPSTHDDAQRRATETGSYDKQYYGTIPEQSKIPHREISEGQTVQAIDFGNIATPIALPRTLYRRYLVLLAELQRIAPQRMATLESRETWREESTHIKDLHDKLLQDLRKLIENLKNRASKRTTEDIADWEDCLIEIEDYAYATEKASERLAVQQSRIVDLDWDLCALEKDLYEQHDEDDPSLMALAKRLSLDSDANRAELDSKPDGEADKALPEKELAYPYVAENIGVTFGSKESTQSSERSFTAQRAIDIVLDHASSSDSSSAPGVGIDPGKVLEDTTGIGDGFEIIDPAEAEPSENDETTGPAFEALKNAEVSEFSDEDFNGFTRWLHHSTPWTLRSAISDTPRSRELASLRFFRAWIMRSLGSFINGTFGAAHAEAARDQNNVKILHKYIWHWLWSPSIGREPTILPEEVATSDHTTSHMPTTSNKWKSNTAKQQSPQQFADVSITGDVQPFIARGDLILLDTVGSGMPITVIDSRIPASTFSEKRAQDESRHDFPAKQAHLFRRKSLS